MADQQAIWQQQQLQAELMRQQAQHVASAGSTGTSTAAALAGFGGVPNSASLAQYNYLMYAAQQKAQADAQAQQQAYVMQAMQKMAVMQEAERQRMLQQQAAALGAGFPATFAAAAALNPWSPRRSTMGADSGLSGLTAAVASSTGGGGVAPSGMGGAAGAGAGAGAGGDGTGGFSAGMVVPPRAASSAMDSVTPRHDGLIGTVASPTAVEGLPPLAVSDAAFRGSINQVRAPAHVARPLFAYLRAPAPLLSMPGALIVPLVRRLTFGLPCTVLSCSRRAQELEVVHHSLPLRPVDLAIPEELFTFVPPSHVQLVRQLRSSAQSFFDVKATGVSEDQRRAMAEKVFLVLTQRMHTVFGGKAGYHTALLQAKIVQRALGATPTGVHRA